MENARTTIKSSSS